MKNIYSVIRYLLNTLILFTGINQEINAGPYVAACIGINCYYFHAASLYGLFTAETKDLYAAAGYDNYLWNTGANTQSVIATSEGTYSVQTSNNGNVCAVADSVHVVYSRPYEDEEIGLATVDLESGDNLVWERTLDKGTDYYEIYRGTNSANLQLYDRYSKIPQQLQIQIIILPRVLLITLSVLRHLKYILSVL